MLRIFKRGNKAARKKDWRCEAHPNIERKLARIEGENIVIIILITTILILVLERLA